MKDFYLHPDGRVSFDIKAGEMVVGMLTYDALTDQTHECISICSAGTNRFLIWNHTEAPEHLARIKTALLLLE